MSALATTSIPPWAVAPTGPAASPAAAPSDRAARAWLLIGVGDEGAALVAAWAPTYDVPVSVLVAPTAADLADEVRTTLARARVGLRVAVAAPVGEALAVRGVLHGAGLEDDEVVVTAAGAGPIEVFCSHCQHSTRALAAIGAVVPCGHCGLGLLVYHHVSRVTGRFLGFQFDAETLPEGREVS